MTTPIVSDVVVNVRDATETGTECSRCRFWKLTAIANRSEEFGKCRYRAPIGCLGDSDKRPRDNRWHFPLTLGDDWCACYAPSYEGV